MKVKLKVSPVMIVEVEGDTQAEVFKELAAAQELFQHEKCGCCQSNNIRFVVRQDDEDHDYFELHCLEINCRARLPFGQAGKPKGSLYPKRRFASLSDKGSPSEQEKRIGEKDYAEKHGGFLPNNGWYKYKKEEKKQ